MGNPKQIVEQVIRKFRKVADESVDVSEFLAGVSIALQQRAEIRLSRWLHRSRVLKFTTKGGWQYKLTGLRSKGAGIAFDLESDGFISGDSTTLIADSPQDFADALVSYIRKEGGDI